MSVDGVHGTFLVDGVLLEQLCGYLAQHPWGQVNGFIQRLSQCPEADPDMAGVTPLRPVPDTDGGGGEDG